MKKSKSQLSQDMRKLKNLWKNRKTNSAYIKWLFEYSKPYMPKIMLLMLINISMSFIAVAIALVMRQIIDRVTIGDGNIFWLVFLYVACILINIGVTTGVAFFAIVLNERFSFGIRLQIYQKITNSYWMQMQKFHTGDLSTRLTSDAGVIADGIIGILPEIIRLVFEAIIVFFTLFYFSPMIAVFAIAVTPIAALIGLALGRILKRLQVKVQESEAAYRSFMQESLANLLVVKSFSNEGYAAERLAQLRDERFFWVFKRAKVSRASSVAMSMTFQSGFIVAFVYGALQVAQGIITYGTMTVFMNLASRVQGSVYGLAQTIPRIASLLASAGRVMELQDISLEQHLPASLKEEQVGFNMNGLNFSYNDDGEPVFENAGIDIKPGEFAAILGESGIGKTTFVRLILSLAHGSAGSIYFYDGQGGNEPANAGSRRFMSYVPQGNSLFSGTIRENLRMGRLNASEEEMLGALRLSFAYDFVMNLPMKLDTVIGERGHGLSEGQAQRIALARAFIKKAPLLILDEATSALDEKTELGVLENLQKLEPRPTCVFITHRKSVKNFCDRSIIIENRGLRDEIKDLE